MMLRLPRPRLQSPLDQEDWRMIARVLIYSLLVIWAAALLGAAVRVFMSVGFGG